MKFVPIICLILVSTTPAFAAPNGLNLPVGKPPIEFYLRSIGGKGSLDC